MTTTRTETQLRRLEETFDDHSGNPRTLANSAYDARPDTSCLRLVDAKRFLIFMRANGIPGADDMANAIAAMEGARAHMADAIRALRTAERLAERAHDRAMTWLEDELAECEDDEEVAA